MTFARYLGAWVAAVALVAPLCVAAFSLRRRWFPGLTGSIARLAEVVLAVVFLVGLAQLLGTVGAFALAPLIVGALVVGALCFTAGRVRIPARADADQAARPQPEPAGRVEVATAVISAGVAAVPFVAVAVRSLQQGITEYDANWYHLPVAAGFVQQSYTTALHFTGSVPQTYFPASGELLHAIGMLVAGNAIISPLVNLGWLALAFLAAWCIGVRVGRPGMAVLAVSVLVSLPIVAYSQGGSADVDLPGVAVLLATVAFVVHSDNDGDGARLLLLAAAAGGLLAGIKVTYLPIVLALGVGVVVTMPSARRRRNVGLGLAILTATGAYWYLRNLVRTGSPLPSAPLRLLGVGFARIPDATVDCGSRAVASYISHPSIWRSAFAPMLRYWFGPLWWLVVFGTALAIAVGIVRRNVAMSRPIAFAGVVAMITYVVTPASAGGAAGNPVCFGYGTRLSFPALALGAVSAVLIARSPMARRAVTTVLAAMLAMTVWSSARLNTGLARRDYALVVAVVAGVGLTVVALQRWKPKRKLVGFTALTICVVVVAGLGWPRAESWSDGRPLRGGLAYLGTLAQWADSSPGMRIAIAGFGEQWPLYGTNLQNVVGPPVAERERGALRSPADCESWRHALRVGQFDHVVILRENAGTPLPQLRWTADDPAATRIVVVGTAASVFRFDAKVPTSACEVG